MPYICIEARQQLTKRSPLTAGELNYMITKLCKQYLSTGKAKYSYQTLNDIIGALEGAKLEIYARVVRPYEDTKIKANGDVF